MPLLEPPKLELIAVEPITGEFVYHGETGNGYHVFRRGFCLLLYHNQEEIGRTTADTNRAGAIWLIKKGEDKDLIGEYTAEEANYSVIPIHNGTYEKDKKEKIHPLDYLVRHIENQP